MQGESQTIKQQMREAMSADEQIPRGGNGSGTARCFRVQARTSEGCGPISIVGVQTGNMRNCLTDSEWETLFFEKGPVGVPSSKSWFDEYARHDFLSYQAAQSLRWWFLAEQGGCKSIETRLVEYEFKYTYSAEPVQAHCLVDPEKREDILPDWGSPKKEARKPE